jgi:hypothetical protein
MLTGAVVLLATQPTKQGTLEQADIQPISLRSSLLARDRDTCGMYDEGLNPSDLQPTCQPETITTSLEGNDCAIRRSRPLIPIETGHHSKGSRPLIPTNPAGVVERTASD